MATRNESIGKWWGNGRIDGSQEGLTQKWAEDSYFLWLSVSVIPWADTLK